MNIQLIQGEFSPSDTLELINEMIQIKIKYHENKIVNKSTEEEIKFRESKIKELQKQLFDLRNYVNNKKVDLKLKSEISVN